MGETSGISIRLANNYSRPVRVEVLGNNASNMSQIGADTSYEWDLSSETFGGVDTIAIEVRKTGEVAYETLFTALTDLSIGGCAKTLSTLNIGYFEAQGNIIYALNKDLEYGEIELRLGTYNPTNTLEAAYNFAVPVGSVLRNETYPTQSLFNTSFSGAVDNAVNNTNALSWIQTYGIRTLFLLNGVATNDGGASVVLTTSSPKSASLQPIFVDSNGLVTQGYSYTPSGGATGGCIVFPTGNANEVTAITLTGMNTDILYYDNQVWPNLTTITYSSNAGDLTSAGGMLDQLTGLNTFNYYNNGVRTISSGFTTPEINAVNLSTLNLDGPAVIPASTFTTNTDFNLGTSSVNNLVVESYNNAYNNFSLAVTNNEVQHLYQFNDNMVVGSAFNTKYENKQDTFATGQLIITNGSGLTFDDLSTPIKCNGWFRVRMNISGLTNFPPIAELNQLENTGTAFAINLLLNSNALPVSVVNQVLIDLDSITTGYTGYSGTINLSGQTPSAPPSGAGATAKTNLIGKGFTLITD
jgi:hypothetical protein